MRIFNLYGGVFLSRMVMVTTPEVVENATFIFLQLPTWATKTTKKEDIQWPNDVSLD
jgi:hypothetical protein